MSLTLIAPPIVTSRLDQTLPPRLTDRAEYVGSGRSVRGQDPHAFYPACMVEPTPTDRQARVDPESLERLGAEIRDASGPIEQDRLYELADRLGIDASQVILRTELKARFPEVQYVRRAFSWRAEAEPDSEIDSTTPPTLAFAELLDTWAAEPSPEARDGLARQISEAVNAGSLSDSDIALARGVGAVDGDIAWSLIPLDGSVPGPIITRLAERATSAWLIDAATALPARAADAPKRRLHDLPVVERNEIAAQAIDRWTNGPAPASDAPGRIRRLRTAVGEEFTPLLVTSALNAARRTVESDGETDEFSLQLLASLASFLATAEPEMVVAGIDRVFNDRELMRRWLAALASSGKNSSDRVKLISVTASTQIRSAIFDSAVYDKFDIKVLGALLSEPHMSELLSNGLADHVRTSVKRATPTKVGQALAAVADFPVLEHLVPVDYLSKRLESDEPSARLARAIASTLVDDAVREAREARRGST